MSYKQNSILIKDLNILDSYRDSFFQGSILIQNKQFEEILIEDPQKRLDNHCIDGRGLWAIPSLIDSHAHITFDPKTTWDLCNINTDGIEKIVYKNLDEALLAGVCLIRDLGCTSKSYCAAQKNKTDYDLFPDVIWAGEPLCPEGGHGCSFGKSITSESEIDKTLYRHKHNGFGWVKIMNDPQRFSFTLLKSIIKIAHLLELKVSIHAFTPKSVTESFIAGADSIEHALPFQNIRKKYNQSNSYWVPTLYSSILSSKGTCFKLLATKAEYRLNKSWNTLLTKSCSANSTESLKIVSGSDGGSAPSRIFDLRQEIISLKMLGLSFFNVIKSATLRPAIMLGVESTNGSITTGKYANLILLDSDPQINIKTILDPKMIIYKGNIVYERIEYAS